MNFIHILKYNNIKTLTLEIESPFSVEDTINLQYMTLFTTTYWIGGFPSSSTAVQTVAKPFIRRQNLIGKTNDC